MNGKHTVFCTTLAALCFSAVASAATVQAAQTVQPKAQATTIPDQEWSEELPESSHRFDCGNARGKVLIGRLHHGDENDNTKYKCATVMQFGERPAPENIEELENYPASGNEVVCPTNKVFIGRAHGGDENAYEVLMCANILDAWNQPMGVIPSETWSQDLKEDGHQFECPANSVMIGKYHKGDENGTTRYLCGTLW